MNDNFSILIPSRIGSTRLANKPLVDLNGKSLIQRVFNQATKLTKDVFIATDSQDVIDHVKTFTNNVVLTSNTHISGTDRVYEAARSLEFDDDTFIINLQGDEPLMNIQDIRNLHRKMIETKSRLGTLASNIKDKKEYINENVVKVVTKEDLNNMKFPEATKFERKSIESNKNTYHHLGIYCYKIETLKSFISLHQSKNEISNKLEQLRALDNNIKIKVSLAKDSPIGVDTKEDFVAIKKIMEYKLK